jgi:hypothetical protein
MANLLHFTAVDWDSRTNSNSTRSFARPKPSSTRSRCNELFFAQEEGGQVIGRSFESFPYDCASNATGSGKIVQRIWERIRKAVASDTCGEFDTVSTQLSKARFLILWRKLITIAA